MPSKCQVQRRKFAKPLVKRKISNEMFEEWNREREAGVGCTSDALRTLRPATLWTESPPLRICMDNAELAGLRFPESRSAQTRAVGVSGTDGEGTWSGSLTAERTTRVIARRCFFSTHGP